MFFSLSKEINRLKTDVLKTLIFPERNLQKCTSWRAKRHKVYLGKHLSWHYHLQLSFVYKTMSQISYNLFCSGDKRLLSEFLRKWGWFHRHNEHFPKYIGWKLKFQKTETQFCRWKSTDYDNIMIPLSLESLVPFWLRKKRPENAFLTLTVNYRKIVQKNKLCHSKQ